jgi:hypothetical protein
MKMTIKLLTMLMLTSILVFASCSEKEEEPAVMPTVTTDDVTAYQNGTADAGGNVKDDGRADVTVRGVCWGSDPNPTTSKDKSTNGAGTGAFTHKITNLAPGFTYHCRAYATNSVGTSYGADKEFKVPVK